MHSLRLPKRLVMHGDDEKDHMFLVRRDGWMTQLHPAIPFNTLLLKSIVEFVSRVDGFCLGSRQSAASRLPKKRKMSRCLVWFGR